MNQTIVSSFYLKVVLHVLSSSLHSLWSFIKYLILLTKGGAVQVSKKLTYLSVGIDVMIYLLS